MSKTFDSPILKTIEEAYPKLSPRLKTAARYVLKHPAEVALSSLRDVAAGAKVSPTTIVRLATDVGYENYNAFKDAFRAPMRTGSGQYAANASRLLNEQTTSGATEFQQQIPLAISASLDLLFRTVTHEHITTAAGKLRKARRIYVLGLRSMFSPAFYFYYLMKTLSPAVVLLENRMDMLIEEMGAIGPGDVLLAISFEPYAAAAIKAAALARDTGAEVIALTDSKLGPLAAKATQVFVLPTSGSSFYQSLVPTMALLEMLISTIQIDEGDGAVDRISSEFAKREQFGAYWRDQD